MTGTTLTERRICTHKRRWCRMKFNPHKYQEFAIQFIKEHPESMLLLDMGLGPAKR